MKRDATNHLVAKALIGFSLLGAGSLWMMDEYVDMDVMQVAKASVEDAENSRTIHGNKVPSLDLEDKNRVDLAQTIRGKVGLEPVKIGPGLNPSREKEELMPIEPLSPMEESKTLDIPQLDLSPSPRKDEKKAEALRDPSLQEIIEAMEKPVLRREQPSSVQGQPRMLDDGTLGRQAKVRALGPSRLEKKLPEVEMPMPVDLPNPQEMECNRELAVYEARLMARERSLEEAYQALQQEKERVLQMQVLVEERWEKAQKSWDTASLFADRADENCQGTAPTGDRAEPLDLGLEKVDPEIRVKQVVSIVKSMKPKAAARVIENWNHPLAATALNRLSPRISSKILAEMPKELAQRLTIDMVKGKEHNYVQSDEESAAN